MDSEEDAIQNHHQNKILLNSERIDSDDNSSNEDYQLTHETIKYHLQEEERIRKDLETSGSDDDDDYSKTVDNKSNSKVLLGTNFSSRKSKDFQGADNMGKLSRAERELAERFELEEAISKKKVLETMVEEDNLDPELEAILKDQKCQDLEEKEKRQKIKDQKSQVGKINDGEIFKTDGGNFASLSNDEKSEILSKKYPEIEKYIKIYNEIVSEQLPKVEDTLKRKASILTSVLIEFLTTKRTLLLDFLATITFYLSVAFKEFKDEDYFTLNNHPVNIRLKYYEKNYSKYLNEDDDFYVFECILESIKEGPSSDLLIKGGEETFGIINSDDEDAGDDDDDGNDDDDGHDDDGDDDDHDGAISDDDNELNKILSICEEKRLARQSKKSKTTNLQSHQTTPKSKTNILPTDALNDDDSETTNAKKREITKEMSKNKGHILSKKKKIDRNPRVKHRMKFKKAKVRQKGQVAPIREKKPVYDGERGIRMGVTKSKEIY